MTEFITKLYNRIALLSPKIEVKLRQLYWKNNYRLAKYNPNVHRKIKVLDKEVSCVNFDDIINQLKLWGVKDGSLLIVHSSYDNLRSTGLSPLQIINKLRELIGENGTLAMPVIRIYKEEPSAIEKIQVSYQPSKCIYNVHRTPISSGLLPTFLMRLPESHISLHPLNPLCAVGPLAEEMMKGNIDGQAPSPHGPLSSWKFCLDHNAIVISLGTDLRHHNTMTHVAEEAFGNWCWSDNEWYNWRDFTIQRPGTESIELTVRERKPFWGMLYQAEMNRYQDFIQNGIIQSKQIGDILIEFEYSQKLISYLMSRNTNGYPYYK
ncbi:MAG: AAC(3) family N-acetyltransferase [Paludibacteraceae bacterium]|nr:AAC(3) family N-acetyltransferase [Paludibacteraceae bacterium]